MVKLRLRLLGVKATWKRVAEKDEFAMHGLRERDSMMRSAETAGRAAAAKRSADLASEENNMMGEVVVVRCVESD